MHNFKKAAASSLAFLLFTVIISSVIISGHIKLDTYYYQDAQVRKELAGTIDYVLTGSSHGMTGFFPSIIDEELGCTSYNICGAQMTGHGRLALLQTELERNPIKTVVIEVSFNTLSRNHSEEHFEGDIYLLPRLDRFSDRARLFFKYAEFEDYPLIYSTLLDRGFAAAVNSLLGHKEEQFKGFMVREHYDVSINPEKVDSIYQSGTFYSSPRDENIRTMLEIVNLCESHNTEIIFVVTPVSDARLWVYAGHNDAMQWFVDFCTDNNYSYYDFNLLKNRGDILSDSDSFYDQLHLNRSGAEAFTKEYCRIMQLINNGEDVSDLFFDSYEEVLANSPYAAS